MNAVPFVFTCANFRFVHKLIMLAGLGQARKPVQNAAEVVCAR